MQSSESDQMQYTMKLYDETTKSNQFDIVNSNVLFPQTMSSSLRLFFSIPAYPDSAIDGTRISMHIKFRALKSDGSRLDVAPAEGTFPIPKMFAFAAGGEFSMICRLELSQDGRVLQDWDNLSYIHHMTNMLYTDPAYMEIMNDTEGFYPDNHFIEDSGWMSGINTGKQMRSKLVQMSHLIEFEGKLPLYPFIYAEDLIPSIGYQLALTFHNTDYWLIQDEETEANEEYKIEITECYLRYSQIKLSPDMSKLNQTVKVNLRNTTFFIELHKMWKLVL